MRIVIMWSSPDFCSSSNPHEGTIGCTKCFRNLPVMALPNRRLGNRHGEYSVIAAYLHNAAEMLKLLSL